MKLIKTNLLRKYKHYSDVGFATASHLDYCHYTYSCIKNEWTFEEYKKHFIGVLQLFVCLIFIPFCRLTHGVIIYPIWIYQHIKKQKQIIKKYGIEKINQSAEELLNELKEKEIQKDENHQNN